MGDERGRADVSAARDMVKAMKGRVQRRRRRRPKVSMVQIAGMAPRKLVRPKRTEAQRAVRFAPREEEVREKIVVL